MEAGSEERTTINAFYHGHGIRTKGRRPVDVPWQYRVSMRMPDEDTADHVAAKLFVHSHYSSPDDTWLITKDCVTLGAAVQFMHDANLLLSE